MSFNTVSSGIFATKGEIERSMLNMSRKKQINIVEKTYSESYEILQKEYDLHTREELEKLANSFVEEFIEEFGIREFGIWYECVHRNVFANEYLQMKYHNLLKIHSAFLQFWIEKNKLKYKIEGYFFGIYVKKAYNELGIGFYSDNEFIQEIVVQLWGVIKTIHDSIYDKVLIQALQESIKDLLNICGNCYYLKQDLTSKEILRTLYYELCETTGHSDGFKGHELFYDYDGYGNTIYLNGGIREEW